MRQFVSLLSGVLIATMLTATPALATPVDSSVDSSQTTQTETTQTETTQTETTQVDSAEAALKAEQARVKAEAKAKKAKAKAKKAAKKKAAKKARKKKAAQKRAALPRRALAKARTRAGMQYRYGASGPTAFDCSGLTSWAYKQAGKTLPRTSGAQAASAKRVGKPRLGDLVFFHSGGRVYHVGLYAGSGKVFHASRPGTPVAQAKIWTSSVFYGRV